MVAGEAYSPRPHHIPATTSSHAHSQPQPPCLGPDVTISCSSDKYKFLRIYAWVMAVLIMVFEIGLGYLLFSKKKIVRAYDNRTSRDGCDPVYDFLVSRYRCGFTWFVTVENIRCVELGVYDIYFPLPRPLPLPLSLHFHSCLTYFRKHIHHREDIVTLTHS